MEWGAVPGVGVLSEPLLQQRDLTVRVETDAEAGHRLLLPRPLPAISSLLRSDLNIPCQDWLWG